MWGAVVLTRVAPCRPSVVGGAALGETVAGGSTSDGAAADEGAAVGDGVTGGGGVALVAEGVAVSAVGEGVSLGPIVVGGAVVVDFAAAGGGFGIVVASSLAASSAGAFSPVRGWNTSMDSRAFSAASRHASKKLRALILGRSGGSKSCSAKPASRPHFQSVFGT